ncbi:hypothetical protein [Rhizobium sp. 11515TR]|nr:hypothetical protein [Rhizobium sp. 11515TR]
MTIPEKQTEISNLIAILKAEGMMYPVGDDLDLVLADCRRLVKMVRRG